MKTRINTGVILIILLFIIFMLIGYIVMLQSYSGLQLHYETKLNDLNRSAEASSRDAYQLGFSSGYEQAVFQILQQAVECKPVPITGGNLTLNFIALECLQLEQNETG